MRDPTLSRVILRHRAPGHLRFALPPELCEEAIAPFLEEGLRQLRGVRRATVARTAGKLALHFDPTVCDEGAVARKLAQLIGLLTRRGFIAPPAPPKALTLRRRLEAATGRWKRQLQGWKGKATVASLVLSREMRGHPLLRLMGDDPEKAVINFINDAVTFYLIKVHWNLIVKQWLRAPWLHRYEWLTTFYMVFLLVRSRRQGKR